MLAKTKSFLKILFHVKKIIEHSLLSLWRQGLPFSKIQNLSYYFWLFPHFCTLILQPFTLELEMKTCRFYCGSIPFQIVFRSVISHESEPLLLLSLLVSDRNNYITVRISQIPFLCHVHVLATEITPCLYHSL